MYQDPETNIVNETTSNSKSNLQKILIILGVAILVGIIYMIIRIGFITKDNTVYDVENPQVIVAGDGEENINEEGGSPSTEIIQDTRVFTPTNEEILDRVFSSDLFYKLSDNEYRLKTDEGESANTFIPTQIIRGDLDKDLYTDAFIIADVTGAAGVANTAFLVTRKGIVEEIEGSTLEGRILYDSAGFTNNKQLFVVYIQALSGDKERVLYDYSVINGEIKITKVSSKLFPAETPKG